MTQPVRILIVENEFIILDHLKHVLEKMGYLVIGAVMKALQAIPFLEAGMVDFAILDIQLGSGPSGLWLAEQIQDRFHLPFIVLSGKNDKATMAKATMVGASGFLSKPFYPAELQATVELALCAFGDAGIVPPPPEEREIFDLFEDKALVSSRTNCHRIEMEAIL